MTDGCRITIDTGLCRSYGICVGLSPEVFDVPQDSPYAVLLKESVGEDELDDVREAARACPAQAILIDESPES